MTSVPALVLEHVTVRYEPASDPVLKDISFSLAHGERAALLGLNGSGKTTLLLAAAGLVDHEGAIFVGGTPVGRASAASVRRKIGFLFNVPEDQLLFPRVIEDVAFGLLRQGEEREKAYRRAEAALESLGAGELTEHPLHNLSHGQKLRVALAGALVTAPPLLLLDEPSAGLDPPGRLSLVRHLEKLDTAMLAATHDLDFAARLCRRFVTLEGGKIVDDAADLRYVTEAWGVWSSPISLRPSAAGPPVRSR
jgi:cobalt/nickel transport system ATP-binding protein